MPFLDNFTLSNPCPICGRYKTAYKNKCHGFLTSDGRFAYCSREMAEGQPETKTHYGKTLYRHPLEDAAAYSHTSISPSATSSIKKDMTTTPRRTPRKKKSLQSLNKEPQKPWDAGGMMASVDKIIRQKRLEGLWPYQ